MASSVFQELDRFGDVIEYLVSGSKDIKEISAYLKSKKIPDSTVRGQIKAIKEKKVQLLSFEEPSTVSLNRAELETIIETLCRMLKVEKTSIDGTGVVAAYSNLRTSSGDKNAKIDNQKKELGKLKAVIAERDATIKQMLDTESKLSQALDDATREELEFPVVLIATEEIFPKASEWEKQFVATDNSELQIEADIQEVNDSKTDEPTKFQNRILNYANYVRRGIQKILSERFMAERIKGLLEKRGKTEFTSDKQYVKNLLAEPGYTNQQKLALYAAFSEYRHKCWTSVHGEDCFMAIEKMADYISQATGYSLEESLRQLIGFEYVVHLKDFKIDEIVRIDGWDSELRKLKVTTVYPIGGGILLCEK